MCTKEQLVNLGVEKLADIIVSVYQNRPDIQKHIDIILAGCDSEPKKIVALIKKELTSLKRSTRFVSFRESNSFSDKINQIRSHIMEDLLPKSPKHAVEFLSSLLNSHETIFERVDDSGGVVGDAFVKVCADLGTAYKHVNNSIEDIVELVYDRFVHDGYGIFGSIISNFKDALGDKGLKQLKEKLEQPCNEKYFSKIEGLKSIADCQNDVEAYIQTCSITDNISAPDHLEISRRLIKHCRGKEAIEWLNSIESSTESVLQSKMDLKVQALEVCGDYKEAQAQRLKWFDICLCPKVYDEILKYAESSFIESWKDTAIQKALDFPDSHVALNFLKEMQEFTHIAKLVCKKFDTLDGNKYHILRPLADKLCEIDPLAATLLYRKMIEPLLVGVKSRYYNFAAKDLAACYKLSSRVTDWQGYKNHQLYFEELSVQHKRKTSFWSEYTIVSNKRQKISK